MVVSGVVGGHEFAMRFDKDLGREKIVYKKGNSGGRSKDDV